jgi:hypothetical protein
MTRAQTVASSPIRSVQALAIAGLVLWALPPVSNALLPAPAHAQAANVVLENIKIDLGFQVVTLKRVDAQNSTLSATELQSLIEGKAINASELLARFDAGRIMVPEVSFEQNFAGTTTKASYTNLVIESVSKGKTGAWSIGGMAMALPAMPESPMTGGTATIGKVSGKDIDIAGLVRVMTTKKASPDEPLIPLYGPTEAEAYVIDSPLFELKIGKMRGSGFEGRPMAAPFFDIMKMIPKMQPGEKPTPEQMQPLMAMLTGVYNDFAFGTTELTDMVVKSKGNAPDPFDMTIARIGMRDFKNAKIGEMAVEGMVVNTPKGGMKLGQFSFRDFDFAAALKMMEMLPQMEKAQAAGEPLPMDPRQFMPSIGGFTMKGLAVDFEDPMNADKRTKVSLENFDLATTEWLAAIPTKISATLDHLVMPVPPEQATELTKQMGIETIDLSSKIKLGWTEATQAVDIEALSFDAGKLGSVAAKGQIGNVSKDAITTNDEFVRQAALLSATLRTLEVAVTNGGLVELALAQAAKDSGGSIEDYKRTIITGISVGLPAMMGNTEDAKAVAAAIAKFIAEPKSLKVSATAPNGFGASDMMDPTKIGEKIKLTATANE